MLYLLRRLASQQGAPAVAHTHTAMAAVPGAALQLRRVPGARKHDYSLQLKIALARS